MNLSHFFVTGDPMIYGADVSIVLVSVAIIFYLTRFKKWGWLWREWITTVDHKKIGSSIDISSWIKEGYKYKNIGFDEQISFEISKNVITLNFIPGCYFENVSSAQYDEMPNFSAKVVIKKDNFTLSDIKINEK
jgi:hypothetical protein